MRDKGLYCTLEGEYRVQIIIVGNIKIRIDMCISQDRQKDCLMKLKKLIQVQNELRFSDEVS